MSIETDLICPIKVWTVSQILGNDHANCVCWRLHACRLSYCHQGMGQAHEQCRYSVHAAAVTWKHQSVFPIVVMWGPSLYMNTSVPVSSRVYRWASCPFHFTPAHNSLSEDCLPHSLHPADGLAVRLTNQILNQIGPLLWWIRTWFYWSAGEWEMLGSNWW